MFTYSYTKEINADRLTSEINAYPELAQYILLGILTEGTNVTILFDTDLSPTNKNLLDHIVDIHVNVPLNPPGDVGQDSYSATIIYWTFDGTRYFADLFHNMETSDVVVGGFIVDTGASVEFDDIQRIDNNTVRIYSVDNLDTVRIICLRTAKERFTATISSWFGSGPYYSDISHMLGTVDILVHAYTASDGKTIELDEIIRIDVNTVRIYSSTNLEPIRIVIYKA